MKTKIIFLIILFFIFISQHLYAATVACDGSKADCQAKVTAASDGDVITIPPGSYTWSTAITWSEKNITIQGAGIDVTVITTDGTAAFDVTNETKSSFRITGMTIQGTASYGMYIRISNRYQATAAYSYGWRVDHVKFLTGDTQISCLTIYGVNWGVIDNCTFSSAWDGGGDHFLIVYYSSYYSADTPYTYGGGYSLSLPVNLGTNEALYIENNVFTNTAGNTSGAAPIDCGSGCRYVFRYNSVTNGGLLNHPTKGNSVGGLKYEVYNNTFTAGAFTWYLFNSQGGGTGVFFNNSAIGSWDNGGQFLLGDVRIDGATDAVLGACDGDESHTWDGPGDTDAPGWPCFSQVGRSTGAAGSQTTYPVYAWNNGTEATCVSGGTCTDSVYLASRNAVGGGDVANYIKTSAHTNGDKDFCNGGETQPASCGNHTLSYTSYDYPHPLRNEDITLPFFVAATIPEAGTTVSVVFSEAVQIGSGLSGGWTATCSGGVCTPSYASGGGTTTLVLNWNRTIVSGETVTLTYTQPGNGVEDAAGNDFATAEDQATTNNSTYTIGSPEYSIIVGTGAGMKIGTGVGMKIE